MSKWRTTRRASRASKATNRDRWVRGLLAGALIAPLVMAVGPAAPVKAPSLPPVSLGTPVSGVHDFVPQKAATPKQPANYAATATHFPGAASATLTLTTAKADAAAGTPVSAQAVPDATGAYAGPTSLGVKVLSHASAQALGVDGVLAQVTPKGAGSGSVRVTVDYSSFAQAYGGDYAARLHLVSLPACAVTTPQQASCHTQTALPTSTNNGATHTLSAQMTLSSQTNASTVIAATSSDSGGDGGGGGGQYGATSLKPSGSWTSGGASGSFDYTYPISVPEAASSLKPDVDLSYDSGSVDGQTSATQAQSSWIGEGWSMSESYIEQTFVGCNASPEGVTLPASEATGDMCYDGPILTLSLGGAQSSLVWDATAQVWKAADDAGEVVTHHTNANNGSGTYNTDYWTVTLRDGTVYSFGLNELPGWKSGDTATASVQSVPVYSANKGDPCYNAAGFTSSVCTMAYRWNLDYVKDLHGDAMAYYYAQDTNNYAEDLGAHSVSYVRDSHLTRIDYGFTDGNAYGTVPDQVRFGTGDRCIATSTTTCDPLNQANAANWPDVPYDLICTSTQTCTNYGPSFFSTVRLTSIGTWQWNGSGGWNPVDSWALTQTIPTTGNFDTATLWLNSVQQTGADTQAGGPAVTLNPVTFSPIMMANRVDFTSGTGSGLGPLNRYRINSITTETGSVISVSYELANPCDPSTVHSVNPSTNTASCFPVYWTPSGATTPYDDWFNKYVVESVSQSDPTGGSPGLYTSYNYVGGAAWHYDDNEVVQAKYRSYGQYRGYGDVQTFTGQTVDPQTESESWFYRGMNGDWLSSSSTRSVTLTDSQGGRHADSPQLAGEAMETAVYTYKGGPVDHSTITSYWVSAPTASHARTGLPALTANATGKVETWTRQALTDSSPPTWRETETVTSYDANPADPDFGLPLFVYTSGDLALAGTGASQETCQQTTYAPANTALNLVGLAATEETDDKPCGGGPGSSSASTVAQANGLTAPAPLNRATDVISATRTFYDDPTDAATWPQPASITQATPTLGDASIVQEATGYSSGAFTYRTKSATVYDAYGRATAVYDALGNKTSTAYTTTSYGTNTSVKVTNALGQFTTTGLDPELGLTLTATDANNITSTMHYDGLGRLTAVWEHGRPTSAHADLLYTYALSNTAATAVTTQTLNDDGNGNANVDTYSTSVTLYDALLRPRQTQTQAITTTAGRIVSDTFYDSHGWVIKSNSDYWDASSNPTGTLVTVADNQVDRQTVTSYDGLDRPVEVQSLDNKSNPTVDNITYTAYTGDKTITLPPTGGVATATVTDALDRTVELDQYTVAPALATGTAGSFTTVSLTGGTTQATKYAFNAQGRASQTTDPNGESWTTGYDYLGEATSSNDPDSGASGNTLYDADGHKVQVTDSAGHTLSYTYDALGRQTAEYDAPVTAQSAGNEVTSSVYDDSNGVPNVTDPIGKLTTQTSYTTAGAFTVQEVGYNAFGESLGETYTVPGSTSLAGTYTYQHQYSDDTGVINGLSIPAAGGLRGEILTEGYSGYNGIDEPSTLGGLNGYAQGIEYTPLGQVAQQVVGSNENASVTNTYDPHTGALTNSQIVNKAVSQTPLDDTTYQYDASGNTVAQTDTRGGSLSETQCYTYDPLDRLTQAWTTASSSASSCSTQPTSANAATTVTDGIAGAAYWTTWNFDALGQPTQQTQHSLASGGTDTTTTYTYGGSASSCSATSKGAHTLASTSTTGPTGTSTAGYCSNALGETTGMPDPTPGAGSTSRQNLTWDDEGRLSTVTDAAGTTTYLYDATGNVVETAAPSTTTLYLPDQEIALNTSTGAAVATRYIALPGGGQVVESGSTSSYRFEFADPHGTPYVSLDSSVENPIWQLYTPYGAPRGTTATGWNDPNGYLDKPQDTGDGLTTLGARQYDTALGRFISLDPVLETNDPQELNGYTYAADNPITHSDPTGKQLAGVGCPDRDCRTPKANSNPDSNPDQPAAPKHPKNILGKRYLSCPDRDCTDTHILDPGLTHVPWLKAQVCYFLDQTCEHAHPSWPTVAKMPTVPWYDACDALDLIKGMGCITDLKNPQAAAQQAHKDTTRGSGNSVQATGGGCTTASAMAIFKIGFEACTSQTGATQSYLVLGIGLGARAAVDRSVYGGASFKQSNSISGYGETELGPPLGPDVGAEGTAGPSGVSGGLNSGLELGESAGDVGVLIPLPTFSGFLSANVYTDNPGAYWEQVNPY